MVAKVSVGNVGMLGASAVALFKSQPELLSDYIIEAMVETPHGQDECHGVRFLGSAGSDPDYVIDLSDPDAWKISATKIASHDFLSESKSGKRFVSAYLASVHFKRKTVSMVAAIDSENVLHVELLSEAQANPAIFRDVAEP